MLMTSHSPNVIRSYCDSGLVLERGEATFSKTSMRRSPNTDATWQASEVSLGECLVPSGGPRHQCSGIEGSFAEPRKR